MRQAFLIFVLILVLVPATVLAEDMSVMVGFQSVSFGADLGEYYDIPAGMGVALQVGFDLGIPLDVGIGQRKATEGNSGGDMTYQWVEVGPRFTWGREDARVRPDWFAGVGSYSLEIGSKKFDTAIGYYAGLGVQEYVSESFSGRFQVKGVYFNSDTNTTDAPSLNVSLLFGYHF